MLDEIGELQLSVVRFVHHINALAGGHMLWSSIVEPGIIVLDFNRPGKHNSLNQSLYCELELALEGAQSDPFCRAVIFKSSGKSFCAGNDLTEFDTAWPQVEGGPIYRFLRALHDLDVPVIAAVHGAAIGIGATMLLHCDVIYASPAAYLQYPFIQLGLAPEGGSSHLLFEWIGRPRAMEVLLSGRRVNAVEAERLGLISRIADSPEEEAFAMAQSIAVMPGESVRVTKRLARLSTKDLFPRRFEEELSAVNSMLATKMPNKPLF